MAKKNLFRIRPALKKDMPYLLMMVQNEDVMIPADFITGGMCAVNREDVPVGYIRVEETGKGPHVAPIAVFENWRMHGVGKALIKKALDKYGELKLVSNGTSNGFYERIGFVEIDWESIDPSFLRDCLECEFYETCNPKPYILERE